MIVKTSYLLSQILAALTWTVAPSASLLTGLKIGLYTNDITLTPGVVLSDLTEATFGGYAQKAVTFGSPLHEPDGTWTLLTGSSQWTATAPVGTAQTVVGVFVTDGQASPKLLWAERFPTPVPIANPGDGFSYIGKLNVYPSNPAEVGAEVA